MWSFVLMTPLATDKGKITDCVVPVFKKITAIFKIMDSLNKSVFYALEPQGVCRSKSDGGPMKLFCVFLLVLASGVVQAQSAPAQAPEIQVVQCGLTFLQANENVFMFPEGKNPATVSLKMIDAAPFYQKWGGEWTANIPYGTDKKFTLKSYFTVMANGSLWFSESKYRLQMFSVLLDQNGQVVSTFRENTDRVVRDYQILEIEKGHPTLRLAIPMPLDWTAVYNNPTTLAIADAQGPEAAVNKAVQMGLIASDTVKEMGVLCSLN